MVQLVDLAETKATLRIFHDDDDSVLTMFIEAASEAVIAYLKAGASIFMDGSGNIDPSKVPQRVKWATIFLVGNMNENRDADPDGVYELGYLPKPVISLLYQLRDPALA